MKYCLRLISAYSRGPTLHGPNPLTETVVMLVYSNLQLSGTQMFSLSD